MKKIIMFAIAGLALQSLVIEPSLDTKKKAEETAQEDAQKALAEKMVNEGCVAAYFGKDFSGIMTASKQKLSAYVKCLRAQNILKEALSNASECRGSFWGDFGTPISKREDMPDSNNIRADRLSYGAYLSCSQKYVGLLGLSKEVRCEVREGYNHKLSEQAGYSIYNNIYSVNPEHYKYLQKFHALQVKAAVRPAKTLPPFFKDAVYNTYAYKPFCLSKLRAALDAFPTAAQGSNPNK